MSEPSVFVFFYGSYMNRAVLAEVGLAPATWEAAMLPGFDIYIAPRANLVRAPGQVAFGVLATATHSELERLYTHAQTVLGEVYLPEAVLVHTAAGAVRPALCYIAPSMAPRSAESAYVERILQPARELGFPPWYLAPGVVPAVARTVASARWRPNKLRVLVARSRDKTRGWTKSAALTSSTWSSKKRRGAQKRGVSLGARRPGSRRGRSATVHHSPEGWTSASCSGPTALASR
jgi:hypothetical protein